MERRKQIPNCWCSIVLRKQWLKVAKSGGASSFNFGLSCVANGSLHVLTWKYSLEWSLCTGKNHLSMWQLRSIKWPDNLGEKSLAKALQNCAPFLLNSLPTQDHFPQRLQIQDIFTQEGLNSSGHKSQILRKATIQTYQLETKPSTPMHSTVLATTKWVGNNLGPKCGCPRFE